MTEIFLINELNWICTDHLDFPNNLQKQLKYILPFNSRYCISVYLTNHLRRYTMLFLYKFNYKHEHKGLLYPSWQQFAKYAKINSLIKYHLDFLCHDVLTYEAILKIILSLNSP